MLELLVGQHGARQADESIINQMAAWGHRKDGGAIWKAALSVCDFSTLESNYFSCSLQIPLQLHAQEF